MSEETGLEAEEGFAEFRILGQAHGMMDVLDQARRTNDLEARVHADDELRRPDHALDGAERKAFQHARVVAELLGRIDLDLYFAGELLVHALGEPLDVLVLHIVDRRRAELDDRLCDGRRGDQQCAEHKKTS